MSVEYLRKLPTSQSDKRLPEQSVPVDWGISSARKRGFFELLSEITGAN